MPNCAKECEGAYAQAECMSLCMARHRASAIDNDRPASSAEEVCRALKGAEATKCWEAAWGGNSDPKTEKY